MVLRPFGNPVLDGLCSKDQLDLLDSVDRLRSQGINHYVSLPQIIVCGDQSSGKSSVLEAISGVSFPVKSNLCTRFPTELVLRKTPKVGVSVSIVPDHSHSEEERASLTNFCESLDGFAALPALIEKAKTAMAIGSFGRAFSKDLLRVEISGPDRPHLTIVDLPGLIHSETKQQSAADVELVQDVVNSYMKERRSIILAVVSAKNDYANQIVLKLARAADQTGNRTLGVITKPDTLLAGSESEATYVSLARNLDVEFRLGWHVLKNMDSEIVSSSLPQRDEEEKEFFSKGVWRTLPELILGVTPLRERLSKLLLAQIAAELPSLVEEIELKSTACRLELHKLGQPRASVEEQRLYLLALSQTCQSLTKAAVDGTYNDDFFGNARTAPGYQKRIRAVVQNLNQSFAEAMDREGHYYEITDPSDEDSPQIGSPKVKTISRSKFLEHIESLMKRTRGRELPGTFNPMIVSDLFFEQSLRWGELARSHIAQVTSAVRIFLKQLTSHVADSSACDALFEKLVKPTLEDIVKDVGGKTADLLSPHQYGHSITYSHDFMETVQQVKRERSRTELTKIIQDVFHVTSLHPPGQSRYVETDYRPLLNALMAHNNPDMNQSACSDALDCLQAYYKIAFKRFIDDIAVEAVEKNIIAKLHEILSPIKIMSLPAKIVTDVAGESKKSQEKRKRLTQQLNVLIQGSETCKKFIVGTLQGTKDMTILRDRSRAASTWPPSSSYESSHTRSSSLVTGDEHEEAELCPYPDDDESILLAEIEEEVKLAEADHSFEPVVEPSFLATLRSASSEQQSGTKTKKGKKKKNYTKEEEDIFES